MELKRAAELTLEAVGKKDTYGPGRSKYGHTVSHATWMLEGIRDGYIQGEKGHRWLGYAQGLLVAHEVLTLEDAKAINKRA